MASSKENNRPVQIFLYNKKCEVSVPLNAECCEDIWRKLARCELNVKPHALELFGLRQNGLWLAPGSKVPINDTVPLELRLRFKPPNAERLKNVDYQSFCYFYDQVRYDFDQSRLLKPIAKEILKEIDTRKIRWYVPLVPTASNKDKPELNAARDKRKKLLVAIVQVASLNIIIDIHTQKKTKEDVFKDFDAYIPKEVWSSSAEKMLAFNKFRQTAWELVDTLMARKFSVDQLKIHFLNEIQASFFSYFEETYAKVELRDLASKVVTNVTLKILPPLKLHMPPNEEKEAHLCAFNHNTQEEINLCTIEEICNISSTSLGTSEETVNVEIARKNGVPIYLTIKNRSALSFLTALCGYYR